MNCRCEYLNYRNPKSPLVADLGGLFQKEEASTFCEGSLIEDFHSDTLLSFFRFPVFLFIMRNIISFKFLLFIFPVVQIIPDIRTMPVGIELNVLFVHLATFLFHKKGKEKIIPY